MPPPVLTFTPLTELDAVNQMLMSIGQAPVNTLAVAGITDVSVARLVLHNTLREVLGRGWHFNTDDEWPLAPDVNGKVAVPANALSVDPEDHSLDYVVRRDPADSVLRLYDREQRSFVLSRTANVTVKWFLTFEEIPAAARAYIAARAGRAFQASVVGSQILYQFTKERELETLAELEREELESADNNVLTQNSETAFVVYRDRMFSDTYR